MRGLHVDLAGGIAWAAAGLTAGEVTVSLAEHGMAVPFGDTETVGIAGLTLGGGIGWLARKHGLAIDALVAVELVTATGEVLTASADEHPDLFWALRGGGGNFGVVTRFCYRLCAVGEVLGGALFLPLNPRRVGPQIAPFTAVAEPYGVAALPMPYPGIYEFTREAGERHPSTTRSLFFDAMPDAVIDTLLSALEEAPEPSMVQLRVFGGAMGRVPVEATAFAHRAAAVQVTIITPLPTPESVEVATAWNRALFDALEPMSSGVYVNFLEDEGAARIRAAYPGPTYERLAAVKRRYDPANVFHRNQNVVPA